MDADILANLMRRFPMKKTPAGLIRTCPARLTFAHIADPQQSEDGAKAKYNAGLMFPKGADIKLLVAETQSELVRAHGAEALKLVPTKIDWPIKNQGDMTRQDSELWAGMEAGAKYVDARTTIKPGCIGLRGEAVDPAKFYDGCWVIATLHPYADTWVNQKTKVSKRYVTITLNNLLFLADDESFGGGGTKPQEDFGDIIDAEAATDDALIGGPKPASNGAAPKEELAFDFGS